MGATAWAAVAVFAVAYVLIATEKVHRVAAALGGAVVMLLIGATDAEHAFFSEDAGIDWNVIFLLLGMMLIVAVLKRTGVFEYLAIWAVKRARGRPFRVMVILVLVTAVASAVLDNVTTVLLVAPVTFLVCDRLGVPVAPFLIAEALASNIGGTATLVGDPPNIIIASRAGLTYNDFLVHLAPLVVVLLVVFVGLCRLLFRAAFRYDPERVAAVMALRERDAIRDRRLLVVSLAVLALVTGGVRAAHRAAPGTVGGGDGRRAAAAGRVPAGRRRGGQGRGVADAGVLRRPVRHGRRAGQHRRHRAGLPGRHRRRRGPAVAGVDGAAVGLGRAVGDRGQHPVRGHDEPDRRRPGRRERRRPSQPGAVVVPRARRRPRRQRHRGRRVGQRGRPRHRRTRRPADHASGSSPSTG